MALNWFDATEAQGFGRALATSIVTGLAPAVAKSSDKKFEAKAHAMLERLSREVTAFKKGAKLNLYKKAKLGNAFKWTLREAGFDPGYADQLTEWLMVQLQ
jgi:hypothetical protein